MSCGTWKNKSTSGVHKSLLAQTSEQNLSKFLIIAKSLASPYSVDSDYDKFDDEAKDADEFRELSPSDGIMSPLPYMFLSVVKN